MRTYQCSKCNHRWKGGFSILPKCFKCGSRWVNELKRGKREIYSSNVSRGDEIGE